MRVREPVVGACGECDARVEGVMYERDNNVARLRLVDDRFRETLEIIRLVNFIMIYPLCTLVRYSHLSAGQLGILIPWRGHLLQKFRGL